MGKVQADVALDRVVDALAKADGVVVYAGAGMSADSGLEVFAGTAGLYSRELQEPEELFKPRWFVSSPKEAWEFYWRRINAYLAAEPHAGYFALKTIIDRLDLDYFVYTSNVDGLFEKAGFSESRLLECHGNIFNIQCASSCGGEVWNLLRRYSKPEIKNIAEQGNPLHCPHCRAVARPNVLLFDDPYWVTRPYWSQQDAYQGWERRNRQRGIIKLEIGAGRGPSSVRSESEQFPGVLIRISSEDFVVEGAGIGVPIGAQEALVRISERLS